MVRFFGEAGADADRESDRISDRLFELLNQAMAMRATTVAELAVQ
jgi:hypothetical protein